MKSVDKKSDTIEALAQTAVWLAATKQATEQLEMGRQADLPLALDATLDAWAGPPFDIDSLRHVTDAMTAVLNKRQPRNRRYNA